MGCFPACFSCSASKRRKPILSKDYQGKREESLLIKLIRESNSKEEVEVEVKPGSRKRVTFDLSVKDCDKSSYDAKQRGKEEEETQTTIESLLDTTAQCIASSLAPNNRYQNCRRNTDDCEDIGLEESDSEEGGDKKDEQILGEESSESLFSLSLDSRKQTCEVENGEKEVNSPMPVKAIGLSLDSGKRHRFGDSALSPIENLALWNERDDQVILKAMPSSQCFTKHADKENIPGLDSKLGVVTRKLVPHEIGVDTSLSSWLVGSAKTSESYDDDQSLEMSEVFDKENLCPKNEKHLGESSPRSRSQSPVLGTLGSFWAHTGRPDGSAFKTKKEYRALL